MACQLVGTKEDKADSIQKIIDTNISYAQKQIDSGQPENALQALRPLLNQFPDNPPLLNMIGLSYLALSHPARAKTFFEQAYEKDKQPIYALNLSSALIATGFYPEAEKVLARPIKEKSYQYIERIYHNYALTFEKRKLYKRAIEYYNKALDENPSYYLSEFRLGKVYQTLKQKQSALTAYESAYNSCKMCFEPLNELCLYAIEDGDFSKASGMLRHFLANKDITKDAKEQAEKLLSLASKMSRNEH